MLALSSLVIVFRGAGDIATGAALRLYGAGFRRILFLEKEQALAVRRTVSFCEALYTGQHTVEGVTACAVAGPHTPESCATLWSKGFLPVWADPKGSCLPQICPHVLIDATLAKRNTGIRITDAPLVLGVGPGFTAGLDVHRVVETLRGFSMGRLIRHGCALPNTGVPDMVMGHGADRVLRAPCDGFFNTTLDIGAQVRAGDTLGAVSGAPVVAALNGLLRGLLRHGTRVKKGFKLGDIDPRPDALTTKVSDKSLAVGGALLEAILEKYGNNTL